MRLIAGEHEGYIKGDIIDPADEEHFRAEHPEMVSESDFSGAEAAAEKAAVKPAKSKSKSKKK